MGLDYNRYSTTLKAHSRTKLALRKAVKSFSKLSSIAHPNQLLHGCAANRALGPRCARGAALAEALVPARSDQVRALVCQAHHADRLFVVDTCW